MSVINFKIFAGLLKKQIKAAAIANAVLILSALLPSATLLELAEPLQRNGKLLRSSAAIAAEPDPGSSQETARKIELDPTTSSFTDSISNSDLDDYYQLTLPNDSTINLSLTSQSKEADIEVRNSNGEIVENSEYGDSTGEPVNLVLSAGTYYIIIGHIGDRFERPTDDQGKTDYELKVSATLVKGSTGNTLSNAQDLGTLSEQSKAVSDFVGDPNPDDYYRFRLGTYSVVKLALSGLSQNADMSLLQDRNNNGTIDINEGEQLYSSIKPGTETDSLEQGLTRGTYFIRVHQPFSFNGFPAEYSGGTRVTGNNTNYNLSVSATLTPEPPRKILLNSTTSSFKNYINNSDPDDYYQFTLQKDSTINLSLTSQSGEADIEFRNSNKEIVENSEYGDSKGEPISLVLPAGTYNIVVGHIGDQSDRPKDEQGRTDYELKVSATPVGGSAGNTLSNAQDLGTLSEQPKGVNDFVGDPNPDDYYRFELGTSGVVQLSLNGLSQNADMALLQDRNNNGTIDINEGEQLYYSTKPGTKAESLNPSLTAGTYFIRVHQPFSLRGSPIDPSNSLGTRVTGNNTNYNLSVSLPQPLSSTSTPNSASVPAPGSDAQLIDLRDRIRYWANKYVCEGMTPIKEPAAGECNKSPYQATGDSILFSSILCYSGEVWACRNIVESKDKDGGMWRSPQRQRTQSDGSWGLKRFSQDAMLGVLLYLVTEKNYINPDAAREFANHWGGWMARSENQSQGEFSLCGWKWTDQKAMDSCALEGNIFGTRGLMIRRVFDHVDANSPSRRKFPFGSYRLGDGGDAGAAGNYVHYLNTVCMTTTERGGKFNCHLASIASLILQEMGDGRKFAVTDEGFRQNPLVLWVNNGRQPNEEIRHLTYERCSKAHASHKNETSKHEQWAWERSEFDQPWKDSAGWDCVAMINLITNGKQEASRRRGETSPPLGIAPPPNGRGGETFPDDTSIKFCNGDVKKQTLYAAYMRSVGNSGWQAHGWLTIPYEKCITADLGTYVGEVYIYAKDQDGNSFLGRKQGQQKLFCVNSSTQEFNIPKSDEQAFECAASTNGEKTAVWADRLTLKEGANTFVFGEMERVEEYRKQEKFRRDAGQILKRIRDMDF